MEVGAGKRSRARGLWAAVWLAAGLASPALAQTGLTGGAVQGTVRNEAGETLPGLPVQLASETTGTRRSAATGAHGEYRFTGLPLAAYRLTVEGPGYRTFERRGLTPLVGQVIVVDVSLPLARSEDISVEFDEATSGNEGAAIAARVGESALRGLPSNGRDYVGFSLLTPGVATERTPPTGPTTSSGLSFAGQRARANHIMVDGFDNGDVYTGAVAAAFSEEAVAEFQVLAAAAPAEFGHASGGTVNTVTRAGTNDWQGGAFYFLRDERLNAKDHFERFDVFGNPIDAPKAPFHQQQWGATLGGPLRKDRTFAFLSFEAQDADASNFVTIDPGVAAVVEQAGFPIGLGSAPYAQRSRMALLRLDHVFAPEHRLAVRAHRSDRTNENVEPFGGIVARSHGAMQDRTDWGVAASLTDVFGPAWLHEARVQVLRGDQAVYGLDPLCGGSCRDVDQGGPEVTIPGLAVFGRQLNTPQRRQNLDLQLADTVTRTAGAHTLKAGVELDLMRRDGLLAQDFGGRYVFTALPAIPGLTDRPLTALEAFAQGLPAAYFQGYGTTTASGTSSLFGLFAQDRWRVGRLTLEAGLRYQRYALGIPPRTVSDRDGTTLTYDVPGHGDLAPRVSVVFDPTGRGRTRFSGSFGVYHDDPLFAIALVSSIVDGDNLRLLRAGLPLSVQAWNAPGHQLPEPSAAYPRLVQVAGPGFRVPYTQQIALGWAQDLGGDVDVRLDLLSVRARRLIGVVDYNPLVPALGPGRRPDDAGAPGTSTSSYQYTNDGDGWYRGLVFGVHKRMSRGFEALVSYTLSDAQDTVSDLFGQANLAEDPGLGRDPADRAGLPLGFDAASSRGPAAVDQRHRLVASALGRLPWALQLSGTVTLGSGRPFTALSGVDGNGDGVAVTDRARRDPRDPDSRVGRNDQWMPATATVDARLSRVFGLPREASLELIAEGFNLLDRVNYSDVNNVFGSGAFPDQPQRDAAGRVTYGLYTKAYAPRQVQLAARVRF